MIAGTGIEMGETTGCWSSCHADNTYMPFDPGPEAIASNVDVATQLQAKDTITKYLTESRTKVEVRGKRGKAQGGWDKLKTAEEVDQLRDEGTYLDLLRVYADGTASNGYLLDRRIANEGEIEAEASLSGGIWTVVFSRPLNSGVPGDVPLEPGKTYTVGFAIHDDFAAARFHHVTLNTSLALDDDTAQIDVTKQ
jgi:ethylbenzene dehydrogenase